jgi:hypothetical protein
MQLIFLQFSSRSRFDGASPAKVYVDWQVVGLGSARGDSCFELCCVTVGAYSEAG